MSNSRFWGLGVAGDLAAWRMEQQAKDLAIRPWSTTTPINHIRVLQETINRLHSQMLNHTTLFKVCEHTYSRYEGFTQTYDFCTKCDHKKDIL